MGEQQAPQEAIGEDRHQAHQHDRDDTPAGGRQRTGNIADPFVDDQSDRKGEPKTDCYRRPELHRRSPRRSPTRDPG
jgi:hypothetical protein